MAGGTLPTITSRRQPPPQAVVMARTRVPKRSIFLLMPISAPEMAKAMVPMRSKKTISASVISWVRPLFQNTWAIIHTPRGLGKRPRGFFAVRILYNLFFLLKNPFLPVDKENFLCYNKKNL